jgi:hypothetical protein
VSGIDENTSTSAIERALGRLRQLNLNWETKDDHSIQASGKDGLFVSISLVPVGSATRKANFSIHQQNTTIYSCFILDRSTTGFETFAVNFEGYELILSFCKEVISRVKAERGLRERRLKDNFWNG